MMKNQLKPLVRTLLATISLVLATPDAMADELPAQFATPADAYKPITMILHTLWNVTLLFTTLLVAASAGSAAPAPSQFRPGQPWLDANGELINAHGFRILHHEGAWYWYGGHKIPGKTEKTEDEKNDAGVGATGSVDTPRP